MIGMRRLCYALLAIIALQVAFNGIRAYQAWSATLDKAQAEFEASADGERYHWANLRRTDHPFSKLYCGDAKTGDLRMCAIASPVVDPATGEKQPYLHYEHFACTPRGCSWFGSVVQ